MHIKSVCQSSTNIPYAPGVGDPAHFRTTVINL
jgi:hypothetical protein